MIQKNEFPILEYDFDSIEILKPNHGAEQLTLPEKCVFAFLGDTIDTYAAEMGATVAEHFETITKTYPIYVIKNVRFVCLHTASNTRSRNDGNNFAVHYLCSLTM